MNLADYSYEQLEKLSKSELVRLLLDNSGYHAHENSSSFGTHQLFLENASEACKDALFLVEGVDEKKILDCNQAASEIFGAGRAASVVGKDMLNLYKTPLSEKEIEEINAALSSNEEWESEYEYSASGGGDFWGCTNIREITIGGKTYQIVRITDITDRKKVENELLKYAQSLEEALKEKDHLISVVSHEIRTPLNAIIGIADLLDKDFSPAEKQENISILKTSSHSLLALINDILDFSKMQSGKLRLENVDFNLPLVLTQTQRLFHNQAKEKNIMLEIFLAENISPFVKGDPTRLQQVLNNLVGNAIKFTDQGKIMLYVKAGTPVGNEQIPLIFEVKDTGIGIASDKLKEIFEPFRQANVAINRQYGGSGLGLAIVKNLLEKMGGMIEVDSIENKGTTFRVYLTYERGEEVNKDMSHEEKVSLPPLSILYMEDVMTNQLLMKRLCSLWNVKISMSSNGYEGLKKVKTKDYDIILIDLRMPGMDGFETARKIRALDDNYFKKVPLVAVTASSSEDNSSLLRQSGFDDAIVKPILQEKLFKMFAKYAVVKNSTHKNSVFKTSEDQRMKIFGQLDMIFQKDAKGYKKTLISIRKEFFNYKEKMKASILERNDQEVSDIRHKIAGTSFILEHKSFYTFLKSLNNLKEFPDEELHSLIKQIDSGFDELIKEFDIKIQSFTN